MKVRLQFRRWSGFFYSSKVCHFEGSARFRAPRLKAAHYQQKTRPRLGLKEKERVPASPGRENQFLCRDSHLVINGQKKQKVTLKNTSEEKKEL